MKGQSRGVLATSAAQRRKQPRTRLGQHRRARILDIAEREFLTKGYVGASLNGISARAGGSKASIALYFRNKAGLFAAVIENRVSSLVHVLEERSVSGTPREVLVRLGEEILPYMLRSEGLMARRGMYAVGLKHRELPEMFFNVGHAPIVGYVAGLLRRWRTAGLIRLADPDWAACMFVHLLGGGIHEQMLAGLRSAYTAAEVRQEVRAVAGLFLAGVAARRRRAR
jgi:TetR/AcrR family transcriptional regulator, mexJK operon transcriptional repressor